MSLCVALIGLLVSVGLAVFVAARGPFAAYSGGTRVTFDWESEYNPQWLMTVDERGWGWTRRGRSAVSPTSYGVGGASIILELGAADPPTPPYPIEMPPHGDLSNLEPEVLKEFKFGAPGGTLLSWPIETQYGWPMRCLRYWNDGVYGWGSFGFAAGSTPQRVVGGVTITPGKGPFDRKVLPYEPIPLGLLVDTLVMGGLVFCFGAMRRWALRKRRRIRGHCEKCGYDLTGVAASVCPECGAGRGALSDGATHQTQPPFC